MSTPPKDPKSEDAARRAAGPALEHTFLGVAPAAPEAPLPAGSGGSAAGGSAIIAAPMISVSGDRASRATAAPTTPPSTPPAAPAIAPAAPASPPAIARTSLQGGWQSAGMPRPALQDQTALHGTPGTPAGWAPPAPVAAQPVPVVVPVAARPAAQPPRPTPQAQGPRPGATPSPPAAGAGLQHTALASDYLHAARKVALGAAVPVPNAHAPAAAYPGPAAHAPHQQTFAPSMPGRGQEPPARAPIDIPVNLAESFIAYPAASRAPSTVAPPATAELSQPGPLPVQAPAPALVFAPDPEQLHGPRSIGTQASVAPPPSNNLPAAVVNPAAGAPAGGAMASAASPVRHLQPHTGQTGTMLERTPSIPGGAVPRSSASAVVSSAAVGSATRFEQVPPARSSLQATGFGLQIPIDQSSADWSRTGLDAAGGSAKPKKQPPSQLRMILLAALAVAAIGFATFGKQLIGRWQHSPTDGIAQSTGSEQTVTPDQATLTNLPSPPATPVAAVPAPGATPNASSPTAPAAPTPVAASAPATHSPALDPGAAKAAVEAGKAAEAAATPESRLAARAGRHVLAARYADALPLYRELQRSYPQNTAYAAMTHVLEQKTATAGKPAAQP